MAAKKDSSIAAPVVSDKKKALETAMQQIEKTYGKGSIMRYGDNVQPNVEAIPTGSLALDLALGIGGVPRGRIIEIYGPESSGKTTLALHVLAQAQKMGGEVAFVDAEHALDPTYARALGVKIEDMLISQPDTGEQAREITEVPPIPKTVPTDINSRKTGVARETAATCRSSWVCPIKNVSARL